MYGHHSAVCWLLGLYGIMTTTETTDYSHFWSSLANFLVFMIMGKKLEKIQRLTSQGKKKYKPPKVHT